MADTKPDVKIDSRNAIPSSLRFPKVDLNASLEKIKILFNKNTTNAMSTNAMLADLGHPESSSVGNTGLAALKYYGLLESTENDLYKIAEFILDYCVESPLKREDIKKCLLSVPVNKKIFATYDIENLPGENQIRAFLLKECKYSIKEATTYIDTFKKDIAIYNTLKNGSPSLNGNSSDVDQSYGTSLPLLPAPVPATPVFATMVTAPVPPSELCVYTHPLSDGKYITIQLPDNINELDSNDLEDASDLLKLVLSKIDRCIKHLEE